MLLHLYFRVNSILLLKIKKVNIHVLDKYFVFDKLGKYNKMDISEADYKDEHLILKKKVYLNK